MMSRLVGGIFTYHPQPLIANEVVLSGTDDDVIDADFVKSVVGL